MTTHKQLTTPKSFMVIARQPSVVRAPSSLPHPTPPLLPKQLLIQHLLTPSPHALSPIPYRTSLITVSLPDRPFCLSLPHRSDLI